MAFDPLLSQGLITALKVGAAMGNVIARDMVTESDDDVFGRLSLRLFTSLVQSKIHKEK